MVFQSNDKNKKTFWRANGWIFLKLKNCCLAQKCLLNTRCQGFFSLNREFQRRLKSILSLFTVEFTTKLLFYILEKLEYVVFYTVQWILNKSIVWLDSSLQFVTWNTDSQSYCWCCCFSSKKVATQTNSIGSSRKDRRPKVNFIKQVWSILALRFNCTIIFFPSNDQ